MPYAAALSEHPVTAYAVGEVVGAVAEALGDRPDAAMLFVTMAHAGALEDAAAAVRAVLEPGVLVGAASESVVGTGREVEHQPAVSLWAGHTGPARAVRITAAPSHGSVTFMGMGEPEGASTLVLLADPWSFPVEEFLSSVQERHPHLTVVGGLASGARGLGGTRLAVDGHVVVDGAVGVLLDSSAHVATVVSQGCRPIGEPLVVTEASGRALRQLAGRPPLARLDEMAATLPPEDVRLINRAGLYLGRVIDEHKATFGIGDFLVRSVAGGDRASGALRINDIVDVGTTVQFHVRDAASADDDLRTLLARAADPPAGALLFTCNGRGAHLFGEPDHDAGLISEVLGGVPTAGMFANGEIGPVGGHNFLHGFTASIALFGR